MENIKIIEYDKNFSEGCTKKLIFFVDINLKSSSPRTATTYQDLKDKLANFNEGYLLTNQTEALSFDMFNVFDLIIIHNTSKSWLMFKPSEDGKTIISNIGAQKEMRFDHNFKKLWISCWQDL